MKNNPVRVDTEHKTGLITRLVNFRCLGILLVVYNSIFTIFIGLFLVGVFRSAPQPMHESRSDREFNSIQSMALEPAAQRGRVPADPARVLERRRALLDPPARNKTATVTRPPPAPPTPPTGTVPAEAASDFTADPGNVLLLYSAYYDTVRQPPVVTVLAIANRSATNGLSRLLTCNLFDKQAPTRSIKVPATLVLVPDHHGKGFAPAFVYCSLPSNVTLTPSTAVSVTLPPAGHPIGPLPVQLPVPRQFNFLICFSPLHHNFNDYRQVVANLELARTLGAEHAVVYNNSIGSKVDRALRQYAARGFVDTMGWRGVPLDVHYQAQILAINDCLLRHRHRTRWIVFMDFDEMIVPRAHASWPDLLRHLEEAAAASSPSWFRPSGNTALETAPEFTADVMRRASALKPTLDRNGKGNYADVRRERDRVEGPALSGSSGASGGWTASGPDSKPFRVGALAFVSSVFLWDKVTNLTVGDKRFADGIKLSYLLKQKRTVELWPLRSKNIVDPRTVDAMGIHRVFSFLDPQHKTLLLNETVGLLQHYRWYNPSAPAVRDVNVLRFASTLVQRMNDTFNRLGIPV